MTQLLKKTMTAIICTAMLSGCAANHHGPSTRSISSNTSQSASKYNRLSWYTKPGKTDLEDFQNISIIDPNNGYGSYQEQIGYGPEWVHVGTTAQVNGDKYNSDAIIGIRDGKKKIYDFEGKTHNKDSFSEFNYDYILGAYVYDEQSESNTINYFDENFGMHTSSENGIGGELMGDDAVYCNGVVYNILTSSAPAADFAPDAPVIIPVANSFTFQHLRQLRESSTFFSNPDGYVVLQKGKDPAFIPDGMTPAYYEEVTLKEMDAPKSVNYHTSFVNDVVKLLDSDGKIHLWKYSTQSFITNESFDDATYFEDGIIGVKKGNKWAFMDESGKMLTDYIFEKVSAVCQGKAYVVYNDRVGILNLN